MSQEWYRSCKATNIQLAMNDLLCQPLKTLRNDGEFTYTNPSTDGAQIATRMLIKSSDIVKEGTLLVFC